MTTLTFDLPSNLRLRVSRDEVSFSAYIPELPAHVRFLAPALAGRQLLEAFEQDFLDATLEVTGEFGANNTFIVHRWETRPLP